MEYIRLSKNYNINTLIPVTDSPYEHMEDKEAPWFVSMFKYSQEHFENWKKTKSLANIHDNKTNNFWVDFDSHTDLQQTLIDATTLCQRLFQLGVKEENIQISFSGNKGIGIIVETDKEFNQPEIKALATKLAGDLETFDSKMYDNQRIFRLMFTKNEKTGLYKIPLTFDDLKTFSVDDIKESAQTISGFNIAQILEYYQNYTPTPEFLALTEAPAPKEVKPKYEFNINADAVNYTGKPSTWRNCKWTLLQGEFKAGERNVACMVLASTLKGMGFDRDTAYYMCIAALEKSWKKHGKGDFTEDELETNVIDEVFSDEWVGGQYSCAKEGWLQTYCNALGEHKCKNRDDELKIVKIENVQDQFKHFVLNIEKNTIKTGLKELDQALPLTIGMNLAVLGASASGKTSLALEILKNTSKAGVVSVFASLDMHRNRVYEKLLYKVSGGKSREVIYDLFKNNKESELLEKIKVDYKNVYFYDRSAPSVQDIKDYIKEINKTNETQVKLVMLDYFERVNSSMSEDTAASKDVAGQLQDLVNDLNICLVTLVQPNKFSLTGGPNTPLLSYTSIKGSSFLYQSFRSIISIWRPFLTPETMEKDKFMQMAILKNDLGELKTFDFGFEGKTGRIYPLEEHQKQELKTLIAEKGNTDGGDGWNS